MAWHTCVNIHMFRADDLAADIQLGAAAYKTEHFFIPFGGDFQYSNAELMFKVLIEWNREV